MSRSATHASPYTREQRQTQLQPVVVTHLLSERPVFLSAVTAGAELASLIPKPRSVDPMTLTRVADALPVHRLSRDDCADSAWLLKHLETCVGGQAVVLIDIGGYFAPALSEVAEHFSGRVLGVVEDTENGLQRYRRIDPLPCPVYSVARSPLKEAEDYLVGQSVVFSIEALLRSGGDILQGRPALVVGFGKVGRSAAGFLRGRGVRVSIHDVSAMKRAEALAHGYEVHETTATALPEALLVVGATGNRSLSEADLEHLRRGAYVASVTSSDDELEMAALTAWDRAEVDPQVVRYSRGEQHFFLLNDGNAVNFVHGAVVGPFIHLVQAEMLVAIWSLQHHAHAAGFHEIDTSHREHLAKLWMRCFGARSDSNGHLRGVAT
jgi:adenosylhomocysteinase